MDDPAPSTEAAPTRASFDAPLPLEQAIADYLAALEAERQEAWDRGWEPVPMPAQCRPVTIKAAPKKRQPKPRLEIVMPADEGSGVYELSGERAFFASEPALGGGEEVVVVGPLPPVVRLTRLTSAEVRLRQRRLRWGVAMVVGAFALLAAPAAVEALSKGEPAAGSPGKHRGEPEPR